MIDNQTKIFLQLLDYDPEELCYYVFINSVFGIGRAPDCLDTMRLMGGAISLHLTHTTCGNIRCRNMRKVTRNKYDVLNSNNFSSFFSSSDIILITKFTSPSINKPPIKERF